MTHVEILVYDGFDELDAIGPFEVFSVARAAGAALEVRLVSLDGAAEIVAAHGLRLRPEGRFEPEHFRDVLVVPGGGWVARSSRGARAEAERGVIPAAIAAAHRGGSTIAAVCTGAMLLAAAGLLRGRPATTHHAALDDLRATGAHVVEARVVDDGDIVTAGGVTSGIDLALWMVERFIGPEVAKRVERGQEYERRGPDPRLPGPTAGGQGSGGAEGHAGARPC
jgi:transcriptional regulator GlxA family with amidase domain